MPSAIPDDSNDIHKAYDIIFAGGGTTACITAGRLAAADPSLKILIIEAGSHTRGLQNHIQPARFFGNFGLSDPPFAFHTAKPSDALDGRSVTISVPRCFGGGSSVNFVMYTRAAASDYDDWELGHGNAGWGSKDLIPLLQKAETYQPLAGAKSVENATHGDSGPLKISYTERNINVGLHFLDAARAYDTEREFTDDTNGFFSCNRYGRWAKYVDGTTGMRSDIPHHYIYNRDHDNLKIEDRCYVKRVIFEDNRAIGVEYIDNKIDGAKETQGVHVAYASRLVVISSGTFGSSAILERSGIGAASLLEKYGIEQVVDLPGVGEHYMDHEYLPQTYIASEEAETIDVINKGGESEIQPHVEEWLKTGTGLLATNGLDAGIKIRPNENDLKNIGPIFEERWKTHFANAPDKPVAFIGTMAGIMVPSYPVKPHQKYFSVGCFSLYPESLGRIHITSGTDVHAPLDFEAPFLNSPSDIEVMRWVYKKGRELARRMNMYRGEVDILHPPFPAGSAATATTADAPVDAAAPDIVYSAEDDKAIDQYHREYVSTAWHFMGTCAMKPRDSGGVVDPSLNVYGVRNLKVSDLSIAPANVGSNTYNSAIAIGEKTAMIIAEELGITGV